MSHNLQFYIDGQWVAPVTDKRLGVVNPSTEEVFIEIAVGSKADADKAVAAARQKRAVQVRLNYPNSDAGMPFGGYKQSGNGREYGIFGLDDFTEIKGIAGYFPE